MPDTPQDILTPAEAAALVRARQVLKAIDARCTYRAWDADDKRRAFDLGKVSEAADAAEHACFSVLNVAHAYADCRVSGNAIDSANGHELRYPDAPGSGLQFAVVDSYDHGFIRWAAASETLGPDETLDTRIVKGVPEVTA